MNDLQKLAASYINSGGFSDKPSAVVFDKPFTNRTGFQQLRSIADRTGIQNYGTGRPFSPTSLKEIRKHPLKYVEYVKEKPKTEAERLDDFYNPRKSHFAIGEVFEDLLRYGMEYVLDTKFDLIEGSIAAGLKTAAHDKGKKCVRMDDWQTCLRMHFAVKEYAPEYVERLRDSAFEAPAFGNIDVGPNQILVSGFLDGFHAETEYATDIKTIDKISEAYDRVFDKPWGAFHYWMQPATYHGRHNFETFEFMFVSKADVPDIMFITFTRSELDELHEYLKETVLSEAAYYLENGFQMKCNDYRKGFPRIRPAVRMPM